MRSSCTPATSAVKIILSIKTFPIVRILYILSIYLPFIHRKLPMLNKDIKLIDEFTFEIFSYSIDKHLYVS